MDERKRTFTHNQTIMLTERFYDEKHQMIVWAPGWNRTRTLMLADVTTNDLIRIRDAIDQHIRRQFVRDRLTNV